MRLSHKQMDLLGTHTYLLSNLLGLPAIAVAFLFSGPHRTSGLLAGALEVLHSPPLIFFNGVYWSPERVGGLTWGLEDVLVCFSLGAGVWFAALAGCRRPFSYQLRYSEFALRAARIAVPTIALSFVVWSMGAGLMETLLLVMIAACAGLLAIRPALARFAVCAALLYPPYYLAILYGTGWLAPDFFLIWNGTQLWNITVAGLPLEEIAFVIVFSFCYPLIIGYSLDVRFDPPAGDKPAAGKKLASANRFPFASQREGLVNPVWKVCAEAEK